MAAYLITGRGGSGKSTICNALQARGYPAYDGDSIPHLSRWEDAHTGKPVSVDTAGFIDYSRVSWNWNGTVLQDFLAQHDPVFLCGSASNQLTFHALFNKVFVLDIDEATHARRLRARESDYGKHPAMEQSLIARHQAFVQEAVRAGALAVNAAQPLDNTVDEILEYIGYGA